MRLVLCLPRLPFPSLGRRPTSCVDPRNSPRRCLHLVVPLGHIQTLYCCTHRQFVPPCFLCVHDCCRVHEIIDIFSIRCCCCCCDCSGVRFNFFRDFPLFRFSHFYPSWLRDAPARPAAGGRGTEKRLQFLEAGRTPTAAAAAADPAACLKLFVKRLRTLKSKSYEDWCLNTFGRVAD